MVNKIGRSYRGKKENSGTKDFLNDTECSHEKFDEFLNLKIRQCLTVGLFYVLVDELTVSVQFNNIYKSL